ncbi:MAG: hypothetical protein M3070_18855 [Actinomycetota bacterium]|nr:hypothetical protein [Actinomycetota bacterium]
MSCDCCTPASGLTPLIVENRAGLSAIAYRVGTYASFRETMLARISAVPELAGLTTREDDDASITVLSLWAAVADVLSFYQERYAGEAFLRTATQRSSVGRLAALIDYRLRPGVAALAWLAFTVEDGKELRVPRGLRVQSVPGQDELAQTFETIAELHAVAALSQQRVLPPPYGATPLAAGATEALLDPGAAGRAAAVGIAARDRVLLYAPGSAGRVEELLVREVRIVEGGAALVWQAPLRASWPDGAPAAKAGRVFQLFGHNAPASVMTPASDPTVPGGIRWSKTDTKFSLPASTKLALDSRVEGLTAGMRLLVHDAAGATTPITVTAVQTTVPPGGTTASVSVLTVTPSVPATGDRRSVVVHELLAPSVVFWGHAYPGRLTSSAVVLPGVAHMDGTFEVGRPLVRGQYQPGVRLRARDLQPGRPVLVGDAETPPALATVLSAKAVGATISVAPTSADAASVRQLGLSAKAATVVSGLLSAPVSATAALTNPRPELRARIGDGVAHALKLGSVSATPGAAAAALLAALSSAGPEPAWVDAIVLGVAGRLVVLPGGEDTPAIEFLPTDQDPTTVLQLGLDGDHARPVQAVLSAPIVAPVGFTAAAPQIEVMVGAIGPVAVSLQNVDAPGLTLLSRRLTNAIAAADLAPGFRGTRVLSTGGRLLLLPGPLEAAPTEFLRMELTLDQPLDLDPTTAFLLANVAPASHGETVHGEVLGDGDAAASFQQLSLRKHPLTYVPSPLAGGTASSLQLLVNGVKCYEVPELYGAPPTAQVFETRTEDDGTTVLQFGDGHTGSTLATGAGNVTATYRVGAGVAGRVRAGTLTSALDRPPGLRGVVNPLAATGGADPEAIEAARANAPSTVRTFGRAVSLTDVADLIRASGEVAKAQAVALWHGLDRAVHVTVAGQAGGIFGAADLSRLGAALQSARDPGSRLLLGNHRPLAIALGATVTVDEDHVQADVLAAVRGAVLDALSFERALLGAPLHLSDVYGVIQDVPGVLASDITELQAKRPADRNRRTADRLADGSPAQVQAHVAILSAQPDPAAPGQVLPAELPTIESPARDVTIAAIGGLA